MGCIGREIAQTRTYIDPTVKEPNLNYKFTYPITVFDAVRQSMDDPNSITLTEMLNNIFQQLRDKQPIFPGKPANYLMTFAGIPGEVGGIQMTREIPWDPAKQGHDKIPTEKAVGDLMFKLGLVDENGNVINDPESRHVRWSDIIGRPMMYTEAGTHEDGTMTQKSISDLFKQMEIRLDEVGDISASKVNLFMDKLKEHMGDMNNPHAVTADQVGAVSKEELRFHIEEIVNPHKITPEMIGLGNVDNTSDEDKPLSAATRNAINKINEAITNLGSGIGDLNFVTGAEYDQQSGRFTVTFRNGDTVSLHIPINGLIDEISYDPETKEIIFIEISGETRRIDISDLFIRYIGSSSTSIDVIIEGTQDTGDQIIHAEIKLKGITDKMIADNAIITRVLADDSVTSDKIKDHTITTINLADNSVTTEKVAVGAITSTRLANRAVSGRSLFSSSIPNRVLTVLDANSDPLWSMVYGPMIDDNAIMSRHILDQNITTEKLAIRAVTTSKIDTAAVTHEKLAPDSVTGENIVKNSIPGSKLAPGILMPGTPMIETRPREAADNTQIPDTRWVRDLLRGYVFTHDNIGNRVVDGTNLFTSSTRNRALIVGRANSNPEWGQINHDMITPDAIETINIKDLAITPDKLKDKVIEKRHISDSAIQTSHIAESAIDSLRIFPAPGPNYLLASVDKTGHPIYTRLNPAMVEPNAIGTIAIQDGSVTPAKVQSSSDSQVVLSVNLKNSSPNWSKISAQMLGDRAVTARSMFTSPTSNRVLITQRAESDPLWGKINREMIQEGSIHEEHIADNSIKKEHLKEKIIEGKHIADWSIPGSSILPRTITGAHLFTSDHPHRVLAVTDPFTDPVWIQVGTEMIKDGAITKEKMMLSEHPYRVLGVTQGGVPPEYLMITHQFIVDGTIISSKLERDFVLQGTPELTIHPAADADNFQLASTKWVRRIIKDMCMDYIPAVLANFLEIPSDVIEDEWNTKGTNPDEPNHDDIWIDASPDTGDNFETIPPGSSGGGGSGTYPGIGIFPFPTITNDMIADHTITGKKLWTHPYGPRVLGITAANEEVEFLLIEEDLIADGAVSTNKLQRDIHLLGSPVLEVRPQPTASTQYGGGDLIPDCQWVLDRIAEAAKYGIDGISGPNQLKEIPPWKVKEEWDSKGTNPDEPEEPPTHIFDSPTTVPIHLIGGCNCNCGGSSGSGGSGGGSSKPQYAEFKKISDKVVGNICAGAHNSTPVDSSSSTIPQKATFPEDYVDGTNEPYAVSDKIIRNAVHTAQNRTKDDPNDPDAVIEPTDPSDYRKINVEDTWGISDRIFKRASAIGYNSSKPGIEPDEPDIPVTSVSAVDYFSLTLNPENPDGDNNNGSGNGSGSGCGCGGVLLMPDCIQTEHLQNRAVTPIKMFTSITSHRVLGVRDANSDPEYLRIYNEMIEDRAILPRNMFSCDENDKVLMVNKAGSDPVWGLIKEIMLHDNIISTAKIKDRAVTHEKLAQAAVDRENIVDKPIVDETLLQDNSVSGRKIRDRAVSKSKIATKAVRAEHLADDIELPGHPTVAADTEYETRSLRNIILSPNKPTSTSNNGFKNGDIWFQYI